MTDVMNARPPADEVGWCHSCETYQRGSDARLVEMPWSPGTLAWSCCRCGDEPWGLGVWTEETQPYLRDQGARADHKCVAYIGEVCRC